MNPESGKFTKQLEARLDQLQAPIYFDELLTLAEDVCLIHPVEYPSPVALDIEATIVASLGTRGVRAALELSNGVVELDEDINGIRDVETELLRPIDIDTPFRNPTAFSESIDRTLLAKAEAFGEALIDEAFLCLGQDAYVKADAYRNAKTADEQNKILEWLDNRLDVIAHDDKFKETGIITGNQMYHPIRLSPKAIGVYPNHEIPPTCLSVSIIAAGFLKRAGAVYLHGDVVRTGKEHAAVLATVYLQNFRFDLEPELNLPINQTMERSFDRMTWDYIRSVETLEGPHATIYTPLLDGTWVQFDPNYRATIEMSEDDSKKLTKVHEDLEDIRPLAPNMEISQFFPGPLTSGELALRLIHHQDIESVTELGQAAHTVMTSADAESIRQRIFEECILPFFNSSQEDDELKVNQGYINTYYVTTSQGGDEPLLQNAFYTVFDKYVLWGEDAETVIEKSLVDSHYLEERCLDITLLPFLMLADIARRDTQNASEVHRVHRVVSIGRAAQRIGLTVLSDFASHTNSPLTASFWLSHWPSHSALIENINGASHSNHQDNIVRNNISFYERYLLTSFRNRGIVSSFLKLRRQRVPEEDVSDSNGGSGSA